MKTSLRLLTRFLLLIACCLFLACSGNSTKFNNVDLTGSKAFGTDFSLIDHHGQRRQLSDFKGKLLVMFYGYTHCPDVCPTTMVEMQGVMELMGKDADKVQVIFVTLDPDRDSLELLAQYVPSFDKRFLGMRPDSQEALDKVTKDFKIFYSKVPGKSANSYTIDHTAGSYVFDTEGRLRLFIKHQQGPALIAEDLKKLLN